MKQIQGTSFNIEDDIVGRITFGKRNLFGRSNDILVCKDSNKPSFGYLATITEKTTFSTKDKPYCVVNSVESFNDGDVVVINKKGEIIFVYEINSNHNALMATERCNHRCIMCPQPPILQEKDKTPFNLQLISLFDKHTQEIGITGGEPTLIGDNLFTLINHIKKELPQTAISILSNGVKFADKEYAMKLAKCRHQDLQIDIPLFSDIAEEHNRIVGAKTFYKTVQGLYNLALFRQRIGLRIVVHKQTYKRLPQFADFIYHNFPFVAQVAFMQMETTGLAKENFEELWIDPYDYNNELREAVLLLADRGMKPYIYNGQLCVLPEDIRCYAQQSISDWKDIYIEECDGCVLKGQCAGFFESNRQAHSSHIKKVEHISSDISC
ncbi:His-Xaa-Ser system radical SAM maturase HxsC [Bacteroides sp. AF35-22]|jgi:His-Xaa-Ser system radical SAM maturase HxsC|uniref:His-Xaa-Ser system radical SAM maturase HxsC n=1 Tax=Bacteroides sp. AF35-22 TaxID=2292932 RepID=UPI000E730D1B|nr:His-Xaa-Ser system radical SAM maturase HxsC [Bacteroides sp. AF35-22]RJW86825.1 His-Xaa-Ser system radical SAM maturase HxsC [Bacteroides sp. AF35-22]